MKFTNSMFNDIKTAMTSKGESAFKDVLKFEAGKTYNLRLVPNINQPKKSIFHYYHHSWNSLASNKFLSTVCPTTFGESCPICSHAIKTYRSGSNEEKEKNKLISRKENWLANVYVVADPSNAENVGKVKMLRYGRELAKVVNEAIDGEDSEDFGAKIFDVVNGCTLRVKCEARSGAPQKKQFVTYGSSKFVAASTLDDIDASRLAEIHASIFDLEAVNKLATSPELQRMLDQHYFCVEDAVSSEDEIVDDEMPSKKPELTKKKEVSKPKTQIDDIFEGVKEAKSKSEDEDDFYDDELKDILSKM